VQTVTVDVDPPLPRPELSKPAGLQGDSSIGVHVMMSREYSKKHAKTHAYGARADMPMKWREDAEEVSPMHVMVRAAAYRHGRRWHNSDSNGSRQRNIQACAARRLSNRSTVSRHP